MTKLTTASVLAFERMLDVSDAFLEQTDSKRKDLQLRPVVIKEKSIRGTISNRLKNKASSDPAKLDAEIQKPNIQSVDSASLDEDCDTLVVSWSFKVLPFSGKPCVCNNQDYQQALQGVVQGYLDTYGLDELARRYATNVANARWLWRNSIGAEEIKVTVNCVVEKQEHKFEFDAKKISLNSFDDENSEIDRLAELIKKGLQGDAFVILYIKAFAIVGYAQEVYPSQEMVLDTGDTKSKELYQVKGKAGMHSQKIGNAIRTIDTWYPDAKFPIAIEPYGAVTVLGKAFRQPRQKVDFYTLLDNWVLNGKEPDVEQQHYVVAVLIRGGVFGASSKEQS